MSWRWGDSAAPKSGCVNIDGHWSLTLRLLIATKFRSYSLQFIRGTHIIASTVTAMNLLIPLRAHTTANGRIGECWFFLRLRSRQIVRSKQNWAAYTRDAELFHRCSSIIPRSLVGGSVLAAFRSSAAVYTRQSKSTALWTCRLDTSGCVRWRAMKNEYFA